MSNGVINLGIEQPFEVKDVFKPTSWLTKIDFINHLALGNNVLISVLGEHGSGKTTFVNLLHNMSPEEIDSCLLCASPLFTRDYYLAELAAQLDYHGELNVAHIIAHCNEQNKHTLIIIDDAHFLPEELIADIVRGLSQQGEKGCFNICLVSNRSVITTLNRLAVDNEDMIHSIELGPLSESETKTYIQERLSPHLDVEELVTDDQIKQFYQLTEGNIVGINSQMAGFFNRKIARKPAAKHSIRTAGIAAGVVVAALVGIFVLNQPEQAALSEPVINQLPHPSLAVAQNTIVADQSAPGSDIPAYQDSALRQAIQATPLRRTDLVAVNEEDNTLDDSMVVMDKIVVIPKVVANKKKEAAAIAEKIVPVVAHVLPKAVVKPEVTKSAVAQTRYTVQLMASHNKVQLERFVQVHHMQDKAKILRTQNKGIAWYVLAYGEFKQRDRAKQAANQLPKELASLKPWVRAMSDLQKLG